MNGAKCESSSGCEPRPDERASPPTPVVSLAEDRGNAVARCVRYASEWAVGLAASRTTYFLGAHLASCSSEVHTNRIPAPWAKQLAGAGRAGVYDYGTLEEDGIPDTWETQHCSLWHDRARVGRRRRDFLTGARGR